MRLPTYKKELIIKKALKKEESITFLSREYGIARKTIYSWIKTYKLTPSRIKSKSLETKYISGKKHPKEYRHTLKDSLIRFVIKNPDANVTEISKGLKAGRHAIYNLLKDLGLTCKVDRLNFSKLYKYPGILDNEIKLSIVRAVINSQESVTKLSKINNIARKTIYEWVKRYKEEGKLEEKYISGFDHPRAYSASIQDTILNKVIDNPVLSIHSLSKALNLSSHGVFNVLKRYNLTHKAARIFYSEGVGRQAIKPTSSGIWDRVKSVFEKFIPSRAPAPPPSVKIIKVFLTSLLASFVFSSIFIVWFRTLSQASDFSQGLGLFFAFLALGMGSFFFLYSLKYYITLAIVLSFSQTGENLNGNGKQVGGLLSWIMGNSKDSTKSNKTKAVGLEPNLSHVHINKHPFISVHIPFYNEKNVVERSIEAATNFNYKGEYEVILCDDSNDETSFIIKEYQKKYLLKGEKLHKKKGDGWILTWVEVKPGVTLKHLHRTSRNGFKGAALEIARKLSNPKTEFISIFDADFVPYPDTLELFLKYFKVQNNMSEEYKSSKVAVVQGYQWHVLNKSENWITRGVRSEYSGSYVIERPGSEIYGGLKQISGSVYMIRKDVLDEIKWGTSITEDFELTLNLYDKGYKVVYTPYIQAPAECVSTVKRLIRQRMRWAEGHSKNIKKMFGKLMFNPKLSFSEKFEFLYLSPYYLQAFFFLVGTLSWFISETIFPARLPFWTSLWGWSLVLTNMLSLPLMNAVGLFLEESEEKDYLGLASFMGLSYLLVPFQAYASLKGFLEDKEGPWFRTPKTGRITDTFARGKFYRFIQGMLPKKADVSIYKDNYSSNYLALTSANNQFNNFKIKPKKMRWLAKTFLVILLILSLNLSYLSFKVPLAHASPGTQIKTIEMPIYQYASSTNITASYGIDNTAYSNVGPQFSLNIPETMVDCQTEIEGTNPCYAYVEWRTVLTATDVTQGETKFRKGTDTPITQSLTTLNANSGESTPLIIRMDVTSVVVQGNYNYNFNAYVNQARNTDSAKLIVTYEYDDSATTQVKTVRYPLNTQAAQGASGNCDPDITINPNIQEADVSIQKAWVEMTGQVFAGTTDCQATVHFGNATCATGEGYALGNGADNNTYLDGAYKTTYDFVAMYEPTAVMATGASAGQLNYNADTIISLYNTGQVMDLKGGELIITYNYSYYNTSNTIHRNTVRYHVGQLGETLYTTYTQIGAPAVYLPESSISNIKAYLKIVGTNKADALSRYEITVQGGSAVEYPSSITWYQEDVSEQQGRIVIFIDISSDFTNNWQNGDSVTVKGKGDTAYETYLVGAELIISYNYGIPVGSETFTNIKTVNWFIGQQTAKTAADYEPSFNTYIPEISTTKRSQGAQGDYVISNTENGRNYIKIGTTQHTYLYNSTGENMTLSNFDAAGYLTGSSQTAVSSLINVDSAITLVDYDVLKGLIAYTTYEVSAPQAPEKALIFLFIAPFLPKIVEWWMKKTRWETLIRKNIISEPLR